MSIFGAMHTSVSGMTAQSNRLSVLSDNIANADTVGYKGASAQFETLLADSAGRTQASGGVATRVRHAVSQQGLVQTTASATDLAIQGQGFFAVTNDTGTPLLTRAGSFIPDASGYLVNTAGYRLMGVDLSSGNSGIAGSGFGGLSAIKVDTSGLLATPSSNGELAFNAPSAATAVAAANLPSANAAGAAFTDKTSLVAFDNLGAKVTLDIYLSKTAGNTWEATVFNAADAASGGTFPYSSGPLATTTLSFDPANGHLAAGSASKLSVAVPGGKTVAFDLSKATQLASDFAVTIAQTDGNAPSAFKEVAVGADGTVSAVYGNGTSVPRFRVALANVPSPDNLTPLSGNVYAQSAASGAATVGASGSAGLGKILSSALESSAVDIASELTAMIETQRSYTANSKAFQIGTDMADVLVNLKV